MLKEIKYKKSLTGKELALFLGVAEATIYNWEKKRQVNVEIYNVCSVRILLKYILPLVRNNTTGTSFRKNL